MSVLSHTPEFPPSLIEVPSCNISHRHISCRSDFIKMILKAFFFLFFCITVIHQDQNFIQGCCGFDIISISEAFLSKVWRKRGVM